MPRIADDDGISMGVAAYRKREAFTHATARLAPDLQLTDTPDYLRWTLSGLLTDLAPTDRTFGEAHGRALQQVVMELVAGWHPTHRRIIDEADAAATFPFGIICAQPVRRWRTPNVTLLGDAIHTMTPGRGEGANAALRDAALLRTHLVEVATQRRPIAEATDEYEHEMLHFGFEAAANSKEPYFAKAIKARPSAWCVAERHDDPAGPVPNDGSPE